jgi:predicted transposase/invertase (TIGR01784 family)
MKQVAPLRYDVIFKKAFGQPEMFAALVGDLLDIQLEIDEVENDKVFIPSVGKVATRFDLFAEDKKNRLVVEVQHAHYSDTYERFVYYQCGAMVETIASSRNYSFPVTVITLVFFTGKKVPNSDGSGILVHDFEPRDLATGEVVESVYINKHRLIFVFTNSVKKQKTPANYLEWMQAIQDSLDERVNEESYTNPHIRRLFELIEKDQITPEEYARMKDEYNQEELEKEAFEEGEEKGRKEGRQEGWEAGLKEGSERLKETARHFKALGTLTEEQIASATGLTLEQVKML